MISIRAGAHHLPLLVLVLLLCLVAATAAAAVDTVVLLVADDLGSADLGYTGSEIKTPTLDELAAGGTQMRNYYVQRACTPTRAALLTGRYPTRYGMQSGVLKPAKPYGLALNETLLPQRLKRLGWSTHAIGKYHLGFYKWEYTPTFRGFDTFYGYYTGGEDYFTHTSFGGGYDFRWDSKSECGSNCSQVLWSAQGQYSTHLFTNRAVEIINLERRSNKLFLYLAYQAVHCPAQVPEWYSRPYSFPDKQRNVFAGMLAALDEGVANVTAALKAQGRWNSTLFIVTNDNGAPTPGCGGAQGGQNWPRRGGKCSAWEGGLHGVGFVHGPGVVPGGELSQLTHAVDMFPTILSFAKDDAASGTLDDGQAALDGIDLSAALTGSNNTQSRDELLLEADPHASPLDGKDWGGDQHATPYYALRSGRWKLIIGDPGQPGIVDAWYCTGPPCPTSHNNTANASSMKPAKFHADSIQLFDVGGNDPYESRNVAAEHPDIVARLKLRIQEYNNSAMSSAQQGLPDDPASAPSLHNGTIAPWA